LDDIPEISNDKLTYIFEAEFVKNDAMRPIYAWRWAIPAGIFSFAMETPEPAWYLGKMLLTLLERFSVPILGNEKDILSDYVLIAKLGKWQIIENKLNATKHNDSWLEELVRPAIEQDNHKMVDVIFAKISRIDDRDVMVYAYKAAISFASLEMVKKIENVAESFGHAFTVDDLDFYYIFLRNVGKTIQMSVLQYVYGKLIEDAKKREMLLYVIHGAVAVKRTDVIQWIHSLQLAVFDKNPGHIEIELGMYGNLQYFQNVAALFHPNIVNRMYPRLFIFAAKHNNIEMAEYAFPRIDEGDRQAELNSALESAVRHANVDAIHYLREKGTSSTPNLLTEYAIQTNNLNVFFAVQEPINITEEFKSVWTFYAIKYGSVHILRWLMREAGVKPDLSQVIRKFSVENLNSIMPDYVALTSMTVDEFVSVVDETLSRINDVIMEALLPLVEKFHVHSRILETVVKNPSKTVIQLLLEHGANPWDNTFKTYVTFINTSKYDQELLRWIKFLIQYSQFQMDNRTFQMILTGCLIKHFPITVMHVMQYGKEQNMIVDTKILKWSHDDRHMDILRVILNENAPMLNLAPLDDKTRDVLNNIVNNILTPEDVQMLAQNALDKANVWPKRKEPSSRMQALLFY